MRVVSFTARWSYRIYLIAIIGGVAITAFSALFKPVTTAVHTAGFATQVLPSPVRFQSWLSPQPTHVKTTYESGDGHPADADIYYVADGRRRAGILVVLGANAAGANDPDVINLGEALARSGYVAMYYWSSKLGEEANIDTSEIEALVAAFQHLGQQSFVDPDRVGLAGFSVGASLGLVAAADPRIAGQVSFVNAFGGYYDAGDLIVQIAAGSTLNDGPADAWSVDPLSRRVFVNEVTENIADPGRREQFRNAAHAGEPLPPDDGSTYESAVVELLGGSLSVSEAKHWYAQLPNAYHQQVRAVSPSNHIGSFDPNTKILLMHDRGDRLIPVGESSRFARALGAQNVVKFRYTETDIFRHVRPNSETRLLPLAKGAIQLFRHVYGIIALAR